MRRGLLIVICSSVLLCAAGATDPALWTTGGTFTINGGDSISYDPIQSESNGVRVVSLTYVELDPWYGFDHLEGYALVYSNNQWVLTSGRYRTAKGTQNIISNWLPTGFYWSDSNDIVITPNPEPTTSYGYDLGPEFAGLRVDIVDQFGNVLQSVVVPEEGMNVSGESIYLDGNARDYSMQIYRPGPLEGPDWIFSGQIDLEKQGATGGSGATWTETNNNVASVGTVYWDQPAGASQPFRYESQGNGIWSVSVPSGSPFIRNEHSSYFGPSFGGSAFDVVNTSGATVGQGIVPVGGGTVTTVVYLAPGETIQGTVTRPIEAREDYQAAFGSELGGGVWTLLGTDGQVLASGDIPSGGGTVSIPTSRFAAGDIGSLVTQSKVTTEDGFELGPVTTVPGFSVEESYGSALPVETTGETIAVGAPTPTPTPGPQPTPLPVISSPGPQPGAGVVNEGDGVPVDVPLAEVPESDLGEDEVFGTLSEIQANMDKIMSNTQESFTNLQLVFAELKKLSLSPPGTTCSLQLGPHTINLSPPAGIREGSKLLFLFFGVFGLFRMIMDLFSS